jgi:hypothetical protein
MLFADIDISWTLLTICVCRTMRQDEYHRTTTSSSCVVGGSGTWAASCLDERVGNRIGDIHLVLKGFADLNLEAKPGFAGVVLPSSTVGA